jgi:hypothetical protein
LGRGDLREKRTHMSGGGAEHVLIKCPKTRKVRVEFVCSKWLNINEDIACKKIMNCMNVIKFKKIKH